MVGVEIAGSAGTLPAESSEPGSSHRVVNSNCGNADQEAPPSVFTSFTRLLPTAKGEDFLNLNAHEQRHVTCSIPQFSASERRDMGSM